MATTLLILIFICYFSYDILVMVLDLTNYLQLIFFGIWINNFLFKYSYIIYKINFIVVYFLTFNYLFINLYLNLFKSIYKFIFNYKLIVLNTTYDYLNQLINNDRYKLIFGTLTNFNLKNYFIVSGLIIYILYFVNFLQFFYLMIIKQQFYNFFVNIIKTNICIEIFNTHQNLAIFPNIISMFLILTFSTIILHAAIGLYMFFYDYFKTSNLILYTLCVYLLIILIFNLNI